MTTYTPELFQEHTCWTDAKIAAALGVTRNTWYRWKNDRGRPTGRLLELALLGLAAEIVDEVPRRFQ